MSKKRWYLVYLVLLFLWLKIFQKHYSREHTFLCPILFAFFLVSGVYEDCCSIFADGGASKQRKVERYISCVSHIASPLNTHQTQLWWVRYRRLHKRSINTGRFPTWSHIIFDMSRCWISFSKGGLFELPLNRKWIIILRHCILSSLEGEFT